MVNFTREELEQTENLAEAVALVFGKKLQGRMKVLAEEAVSGEVAKSYHELGKKTRQETYQNIAADVLARTELSSGSPSLILDVGCGSGLLSFTLAELVYKGTVVGIDASSEMIQLAQEQRRAKIAQGKAELISKIVFWQRSVYELLKESYHLVICRNVLHRFHDPKRALRAMYDALLPQGEIYLRDLRRDAAWNIHLQRIGEERWKNPLLVQDYVGAMAATFTQREVEDLLKEIGIKDYKMTDGSYQGKIQETTFPEFSQETEFVCILSKTSP